MDNGLKCWNCGALIPRPPWGKLPFRESCDACTADLHCCRNCVYYKPGLPNDCAVPGTEFVSDRTRSNLCEAFKLLGVGPKDGGTNSSPKDRFNSLFE